MKENYSLELGIPTVSELIETLQSLQNRHGDWPVYLCGSDEFFVCMDVQNEYVVFDMEDLFDDFDDVDLDDLYHFE